MLAVVVDQAALVSVGRVQRCSGLRSVKPTPADTQAGRRRQDLPAEDRKTLRRAARATVSARGKALLRKRGEHLERGFALVLDHGGLRRATLRGCENLTKRHLAAALSFNLSLLLRTIFGVGTSKQWLAGAAAALCLVATVLCLASDILRRLPNQLLGPPPSPFRRSLPSAGFAPGLPFGHIHPGLVGFSTVC